MHYTFASITTRLVSGSLLLLTLTALLGCEPLSVPATNLEPTSDPRGTDVGGDLIPIADEAAVLRHVQLTSGQPVIVENEKGLLRSRDDGVIQTFAWRQVSGPAVYIEDPSDESLAFTPLTPDTYVFELVVTDNQGVQLVVDRQAIVVQGRADDDNPRRPAHGPQQVRCAVALLSEGMEADRETLEQVQWTSWDACPDGGIRLGDLDGDGIPDVAVGTLTLVKEVDKATPLLYQGVRGQDTDGDGYADVRVHSVAVGEEVEILGMGEERASGSPMGRMKTSDVTLERAYQGGIEPPEPFVLGREAARHGGVSGDILLEQDETFYVRLHEGNGSGGTQVALSRCAVTEYRPFVIDGVVSEPVERLSMRCEQVELKAEGPGEALYAWLSAALRGEAKPATLAVKEVLPDGSDGRVFVSTGAFPKEWTLPGRAGNPLYEDDGQTGTNPLYEGQAATSTLGIEKITLAVENMYQE